MSQNINIVVRMRPMLRFETESAWMIKNNSIMALQPHTTSRTNRSISPNLKAQSINQSKELIQQFNFEKIVPQNVTSQQIYKQHIKSTFLQCFQNRRNMSIMAYGQTCSGKTHTILGTKQAPGINPCILKELFLLKQSRKCSYKVSYIEIYNEKLSDLLVRKGQQKQLKIKEDEKCGYDILGATKEQVNSFQQAVKILEKGQKQRQYGNGEHHERSSRSHTLFRIFVQEWDQNLSSKTFMITIVDLAGSEKLVSSKQSSTETGFINKSLFQLTNVIAKLSQNSQHIPFRDSKLTRLLQPSISGNGRSFLICCVSPSSNCYNQTLSTLRLAQRARKVQLKNEENDSKQSQLQNVKEKLRLKNKQCQELKRQLEILTQKMQILSQRQKRQPQSKEKKCDLLILLDHQNFTVFLGNKILQTQQALDQVKRLKQQFIVKMQALYQSYTRQIVNLCDGDEFDLKIDQICFMNMVLEHQKVQQYKLDIINHFIKEKQEKKLQDNSKFYIALEMYRNKLLSATQSSQNSIFKHFPSEAFSGQKDYSMSNYSLNSIQKSTAKKIQPIYQSQENGQEIIVWGSKKDYRVCKGQIYNSNMMKINSIKNIKQVVCGYHHTLVLTSEGQVYGWGKNTQKQILAAEKDSIATPTFIQGVKNRIKSLAAGWGHSLALTTQGQLYSWGYGKDGQLGLGSKNIVPNPTIIPFATKIQKIFAGHSHSGLIDSQDDFYAFGFNQDYRLMIGDMKVVLSPKRVAIRDIKQAGLGVSHSAIVTKSGLLYCGGVGTNGELGVILDQHHTGWQQMEVVDKKFEAEPYQKICPLVQVQVFRQKNKAQKVRCGENSTFVLTENKEVWSFGKTVGGRVGHKKSLPSKILEEVDELQIGCRNGLAYRRKDQKLYSWGFNLYGQTNPIMIGDIESPQLIQNITEKNILGMSCGFFHSTIFTK